MTAKHERRHLDSYYTPDPLALAITRMADELLEDKPARIIEPSVGKGAFVRAARATWPDAQVLGVDCDATATGLALCDQHLVGDWALATPGDPADLVVANPPYSAWQSHAEAAFPHAPDGLVVFLLRLAALEGQCRAEFWRTHRPSHVWALSKRPSFTGGGTDAAAYGVVVWEPALFGAGLRDDTKLDWLTW